MSKTSKTNVSKDKLSFTTHTFILMHDSNEFTHKAVIFEKNLLQSNNRMLKTEWDIRGSLDKPESTTSD